MFWLGVGVLTVVSGSGSGAFEAAAGSRFFGEEVVGDDVSLGAAVADALGDGVAVFRVGVGDGECCPPSESGAWGDFCVVVGCEVGPGFASVGGASLAAAGCGEVVFEVVAA